MQEHRLFSVRRLLSSGLHLQIHRFQVFFSSVLIFLNGDVNLQLTVAMFALLLYFFASSQLQYVGSLTLRAVPLRSNDTGAVFVCVSASWVRM